jgi:hypothetical protein
MIELCLTLLSQLTGTHEGCRVVRLTQLMQLQERSTEASLNLATMLMFTPLASILARRGSIKIGLSEGNRQYTSIALRSTPQRRAASRKRHSKIFRACSNDTAFDEDIFENKFSVNLKAFCEY